MRRFSTLGLALALGLCAPGLATAQETMEEKKAAKLKDPFLAKADWLTDYDEAKKQAASTGKLIFGYFTRSYAY